MASGPPPPSNGFVREDPRMVPPCFERPRTSQRVMGIVSPSTTPRHPHRNPTNSAPCEITPFKTAPRITALRHGQSPPLVKIPIFMCCLHTQLSVTIRAGLLSVRSNTPAGCRELKALGRVQVYCGLLL